MQARHTERYICKAALVPLPHQSQRCSGFREQLCEKLFAICCLVQRAFDQFGDQSFLLGDQHVRQFKGVTLRENNTVMVDQAFTGVGGSL